MDFAPNKMPGGVAPHSLQIREFRIRSNAVCENPTVPISACESRYLARNRVDLENRVVTVSVKIIALSPKRVDSGRRAHTGNTCDVARSDVDANNGGQRRRVDRAFISNEACVVRAARDHLYSPVTRFCLPISWPELM